MRLGVLVTACERGSTAVIAISADTHTGLAAPCWSSVLARPGHARRRPDAGPARLLGRHLQTHPEVSLGDDVLGQGTSRGAAPPEAWGRPIRSPRSARHKAPSSLWLVISGGS